MAVSEYPAGNENSIWHRQAAIKDEDETVTGNDRVNAKRYRSRGIPGTAESFASKTISALEIVQVFPLSQLP